MVTFLRSGFFIGKRFEAEPLSNDKALSGDASGQKYKETKNGTAFAPFFADLRHDPESNIVN